jgi:lipoate-protein ligase A
VELHYGFSRTGLYSQSNCFNTATGADLVLADSTKLIGSAQLRRGKAILQHGSIRLEPMLSCLPKFLVLNRLA